MRKLILLFISFSASTIAMAQPAIANYSFEDFTSRYGKTAPKDWQSDSLSIVNNLVKRVNPGTVGTYCLQIGTGLVEGKVAGAIIIREDSLSSTPGDLSFDYKVVNNVTSEFNGLQIEIYFLDSKKKNLKDFTWSSSGNNTNFTNGNMPITFNPGEVPKYYTLIVGYFNLGGQTGEYALVDNLKFAKINKINPLESNSTLSFYPNPASKLVTFNAIPNDKLAMARLISLDGKINEFAIYNSSINIEKLTNGLYTLELLNANNQLIKRGKLGIVNH